MDVIAWIYIASITCVSSGVIGGITSSTHRTYQTEQACNYLRNDGNQHNAYSNSGLDGGFCCFCPRGTEWVGDCHSDNPSSTQCKACGPDKYINFEPHLEPKCYPKRELHCSWPKVYFKGTEYEEDRCVCPGDMYEDDSGTCNPVSSVTPRTKSLEQTTGEDLSTTSDSLIDTKSPVLHPTDSILTQAPSKSKGSLEETTGTSTTAFPDKFTTNDDPLRGLPLTKAKSTDKKDMGIIVGLVAIGITVLIAAIGIFLFCRLRKKDSGSSSDPLSSQTKLNGDPTSSSETLEMSSEALTDGSTRPPVHESVHKHEERPLLANCSAKQRCSKNEGFCEVDDHTLIIREKSEKIPPEKHEGFARAVATELGAKCVRKEALPMLRRIVGNTDSNALDDVLNKYQGNTPEMFYQAMNLAIRLKGEELTPFYIWEKVARSKFQLYTVTVENEIEKFSRSS